MDAINTNSISPTLHSNQTAKKAIANNGESDGTFGKWLQQSLNEVNGLQKSADDSAQRLISGENKDVHGTMIAMQKASISFNLVMEVRNKVIAAYEEIKRMQF